MKFIRDLIGRKKRDAQSQAPKRGSGGLEQSYRDTIGALADEKEPAAVTDILTDVAEKTKAAADADVRVVNAEDEASEVNIWDLEDDGGSTELPSTAPTLPSAAPAAAPAAEATRAPGRSRRTKTRLIGFESSDGEVVDLFNDVPTATPTQRVQFPVGWIVVTEGPGRGECFALQTGMSQIGRGDDQAVKLDFGDNSISRTNHAAIVYDPDNKEFLLGHGGKSNIVRLNDKPLISNEALQSGDVIRLGETVLRFVALCGPTFNWSEGTPGEDEDVAIA
ncbi:FHA domain-containing protein [Yoonia sp. BS5-3]|uniref:FHA domain-containing protein n=1 Tax=Yoonia phaeophyticola TaxID=3137369 RepID=A0ABZ2V4I3_9RHOB